MTNGVSRRRFVQLGSGAVVVGLVGGYAGASDHDEADQEEEEREDENGDDHGEADHEEDEHEGEGGETARVRAAHLSPDAPNVDVHVDGDPVLEGVPFGAVSEYLDLPVGAHQVTIATADDPDTVVFDEELEVPAGDFTLAAVGELAEENRAFEVLVLEDDNEPVAEDTARVRLVHASPDAPAVDVTVAGTDVTLFDDVGFGEGVYAEAPAGRHQLCVRGATEGDDGDVVATFDVDLAGGTVYSGFAVGYLVPEEAPVDEAFDLIVTEDAMPDDD